MHQSVLDFGHAQLRAGEAAGKRVLEIGAFDVNGSLRPHVMSLGPAEYIGVDLQLGPGVDQIADACSASFNLGQFDLVLSTEMLEHAPDWRTAVRNMKAALALQGILLLTTRSRGFARHYEHPGDYWRFSLDDMRRIFSDLSIEVLCEDPGGSGGGPGVFLKASKPVNYQEAELSAISVYSMDAPDENPVEDWKP